MRESRRDRRPRSVAARVGQDSGRSAPCVQSNTPGGHQRENVRSARQLSPRRVQFSVAKSVQFSVAIDNRPIRVHPRACGGNLPIAGLRVPDAGPSPRVRGKRRVGRRADQPDGSIPARAGETRLSCRCLSASRVHPRACGGNTSSDTSGTSARGPSPRVRGKPALQGHTWCCSGSIPARAGETG